MDARTLEPLPPPTELADLQREYHGLHERILFGFQERTREHAILAAGFTLEQIAYAVVGGLVLKGIVATLRVAAPTIASVVAQGGSGAVRWFRTLLVRAGPRERALLQQLWLKIETQGLRSLTAAERQQLSALMGRLEKVLGTPLERQAKDAHLFAKLDINGKANLAGVHLHVHRSISRIWTSMRTHSERMRPEDVQQVVGIVNRRYGRWFHRVYDPKDASALASAEQAALHEVAQLKARFVP